MTACSSKFFVFTFVALFFVSSRAHAFPMPNQTYVNEVPSSVAADYNFEGIVSLSNCSGALVQLEKAGDNDLALILTNGHCVETGHTPAGQFLYHLKSDRRFALMDASGARAGVLTATEILYSTMTKTDLTLYKTNLTYGEIKARFNVRPLILSSQHPDESAAIEILSGYWHRGYRCAIEKFITHMKEDQWAWDDSIRYSRPGCETIGGTSGAPLVLGGTRTVVAVNNTSNTNGGQCSLDNPCEIDADGQISANRGFSYAQETYWVYSCLDAKGEFDLQTPGCLLPH